MLDSQHPLPHLRAAHARSRTDTRTRRAHRLITCIVCAALSSHIARRAAAEDDDAAVIAAARALAVEGFKLAQNDQCAEAIDKLERAEKLHHGAMVSARLAECYIKQGRLVEGVERLRNVLREPLPANPSDALQQTYANSKTLLEATRPKLATLTVFVDVAPGAEPTVTIDDHPIPNALLGARRPSDPGDHLIQATAPGYLASSRHVILGPGEEVSAALALVIDPAASRARTQAAAVSGSAPGDAPASTPAPAASAQQPSSAQPNLLPAYITWGASAVALGVGIGFGVAALNNRSALNEMCPSKTCTSQQSDLLHTAHVNATISTIGYVTALAGAALGSVLYFTAGRGDDAGRAALHVGPMGADLSLKF
jgi:hypothetical protein